MDPMRALDMEHRSGIAPSEIDAFATRMDMISQAMDAIKDGTFDPATCKIPGYKSPEQEEKERLEKLQRAAERERRDTERRAQLKRDERERWWQKAELRGSGNDLDTDASDATDQPLTHATANRTLAAYTERDANDYSSWRAWEPRDPATLDEVATREQALECERNRAFEASNPAFCSQFKDDLAKRQASRWDKERVAEQCKQQGNVCYRRKQHAVAIEHYMRALDASPFYVAVLTNIAQCHVRLAQLDDAIEFATRALYIDPQHVKALSRRAAARHLQQQLDAAAADMARALALAPDNDDVVEQHAVIVGEFEDTRAQQQLDAMLAGAATTAAMTATERTRVAELRFVMELLQRMDASDASNATASSDREGTEPSSPSSSLDDSLASPAASWVAYELLVPLLQRNESVRTLVRTTRALHRLCDRIVALTAPERLVLTRDNDADGVSLLLACATAAMRECPRNQTVLYQFVPFRKRMLTLLRSAAKSDCSDNEVAGNDSESIQLPLRTQASVLAFFAEAVELKSWKRFVSSTRGARHTLRQVLAAAATTTAEEQQNATANVQLSASRICLTISSNAHGVRELVTEPIEWADTLADALRPWQRTDRRTVSNLLGVLTNLSTAEAFRTAVDAAVVPQLAAMLLKIACDSVATGSDVLSAERALAALLNLTFDPLARMRQDLFACDAVQTLTAMLRAMTPATYSALVLTLSRTVSLLCRLHAVVSTHVASATSRDASETATQQLTHADVLDELYRVCLQAVATASTHRSNTRTDKDSAAIEEETTTLDDTWQLCAQIWCHVGWCVSTPAVRTYLREKHAIDAALATIRLANAQPGGYRSTADATQSAHARERMVGNAVKVLIAMQADRNPHDAALFATHTSLTALVDALQRLPDGSLARKNVAILLAKLCQADDSVKDVVRQLRGIEMMLAVSQSLQSQSQQLGKSRSSRSLVATAAGAAF